VRKIRLLIKGEEDDNIACFDFVNNMTIVIIINILGWDKILKTFDFCVFVE